LKEQSELDATTLIPNAESLNTDVLCGYKEANFIQKDKELQSLLDEVSRNLASFFRKAPQGSSNHFF
jgi:hypothetical protein